MDSNFETIFMFVAIAFVLVLIVVFVFYLITLQNTLKAVSPQNRQMPPSNVWLLLIPLFNIIYQFIVVNNIADSIRADALQKNIPLDEERPTASLGIAMCIFQLCGAIPVIGSIGSLGFLICWIVYWVKVNGYRKKLEKGVLFDFEMEENRNKY